MFMVEFNSRACLRKKFSYVKRRDTDLRLSFAHMSRLLSAFGVENVTIGETRRDF